MQQKTFDLNTLNGLNGFAVLGITASGGLGFSVRTAGDINNDGITDLILGAPYANSNAGASYVIFGSRGGGFASSFNLTALNGSNGFYIPGIITSGGLGYSVSTAGDINGDGISDIVLGAYAANSNAGASYVIFGSRRGFASSFNLNNLNGTNGFTVPGVVGVGFLGGAVSTAGDINGDGINDLLLGSAYTENSGYPGASYVIFGNRGGFPSSFNLNNLNGTNGFTVPGLAPGDNLGVSVGTAGDVNGDGISDLVLGVRVPYSNRGASYVIFGSRRGFPSSFNLNNLNGTDGFTVPGLVLGDNLGVSVGTAGDVNGDGISDLVLGANVANSNRGIGYVIFGSRGGFTSSFNLNNLNGTNGFTVPGLVLGDNLGVSVGTAGDVNGDGLGDMLLGAPFANSAAGISYVIFGSREGFTSSFNLNNLNGTNGFTIPGIAPSGRLGVGSIAGDINGDGLSDFVLGANNANPGAEGAAYVIFGGSASLRFIKNELTIIQGQTVVLTINDLNAFSFGRFGLLVFTASSVQGGRFERVIQSGTAIFNFTQQQIVDGQVQFASDRSAKVAYAVSVNDGNFTVGPTAANVMFTNPAPLLLNPPVNQVFIHDRPFNFSFAANQTFMDPDGDPLTFSAASSDGTPLPNWIQFDSSQSNQLTFKGVAPLHTVGTTGFNLLATDVLNANVQANFNVTFVNNPPIVMNQPLLQPKVAEVGKPFDFNFETNTVFADPDDDPLTFSAMQSDGSPLQNWVQFDTSIPNQLAFSGISPREGNTRWRLFASDLLNATAYGDFSMVTIAASNVTNIVNAGANVTQIAGSVVGGILGFAALIGGGLGFWRYTTDKSSRQSEHFANYIRGALNLKNVNNFETNETGQQYVAFVHVLTQGLKAVGIDTIGMRPGELRELANDVAAAAQNKITPATDCLGRSEITVHDLNSKMQEIVTEIQVLRSGAQGRNYTL